MNIKTIPAILALFIFVVQPAFVQTVDPTQYDIAKCKTLDEVEAAKKAGREFIEIRGSYLFKIGDSYKGLYPSLRRALEERAKLGGGTSDGGRTAAMPKKNVAFNPLTIVFPFTNVDAEKKTTFEVPGGSRIDSTQVMLHPEPYTFDHVSFGLVRFPQKGVHFAITGNFYAEPSVKDATGQLEYNVGAAVVSTEGEVLWKHYGIVEPDQDFLCIHDVGKPAGTPEFLLMFLLAKGKLDKQLSYIENAPEIDAKPYDYHVLTSMALQVGPNWFPPIDEAIQEEYLKLYREKTREVSDHFKTYKKPDEN